MRSARHGSCCSTGRDGRNCGPCARHGGDGAPREAARRAQLLLVGVAVALRARLAADAHRRTRPCRTHGIHFSRCTARFDRRMNSWTRCCCFHRRSKYQMSFGYSVPPSRQHVVGCAGMACRLFRSVNRVALENCSLPKNCELPST